MVHRGGHLVVQQVAVEQPAGLGVELHLLGEGVADAHAHAAVDLGLRQGGVDELPRVVDVDDAQHPHLAHGYVHLHLAKQQPKAKVFSLQWLVSSAVMWTLCSRE